MIHATFFSLLNREDQNYYCCSLLAVVQKQQQPTYRYLAECSSDELRPHHVSCHNISCSTLLRRTSGIYE